MLFLAKLVFHHKPYEISLGGRLVNTTETNMSMNRQHNKSPPCSSSNPTNDDVWPRFFIVEAADDNTQPLAKRCTIFALNTAIKCMGGSYESVKPLNGGRQLLLHFENKFYSKNLLETNELAGIPVKVFPYRTLNYSRCVLFCKELAGIDEEIKNELGSQGVVKVEWMKRKKDGHLIPADSYILTVHGQTIPSKIKVGYLTKNTKVYVPNPQRCFHCQAYGHSKRFCSKIQKWANCGQENHEDKDSENDPHFANCNGNHPAYFRSCPKWKMEKKILKIKYEENISFHEARKRVEPSDSDPSKNSYASSTKLHHWSNTITHPNHFKSEEEWLSHTIEDCLKRLEAIKQNKTSSQSQISASSSQNGTDIISSENSVQPTIAMTSTEPNDLDNEVNEDMGIHTVSAKRPIHEYSSEEDPASPFPAKMAATGSSASGQSGTLVPKGRGGGNLPKISAFPANAPQPRGRGSSQGDKSPKRAPKFTSKRDEGSTSSANGCRNRGPLNRHYSPKTPNQSTKSSATKTPKS